MKISILLPYKEDYASEYAGAVSLFVNHINKLGINSKTTKIFGNTTYKKTLSNQYINIDLEKKILQSSSKLYVKKFIILQKKINSDLIEVHNRPNYIKQIRDKISGTNLTLFFHNDPIKMNGSKTVKDRIYLLENLNHIIFNSLWSQKRFFIDINLNKYSYKTSVIQQSTSRVKIDFSKKEKIISFVGKLNKAKGYDVFGEAISKILEKHKNWKAVVFGDEPREKILFSHKNLMIYGFTKHDLILKYLKKVSISVVCSRWDEPFGRTSLEAASRGSAVIMTDKGGLPETTNEGVILKHLSVDELYKKIELLINDKTLRVKIQKKIYKDFRFSHEFIRKKINVLRSSLSQNKIKINYINKDIKLKILHVTNFNERHDGRLHYNTGKRINNGFIRLGHNVLQLSDRDILSYYRNFTDPKGVKKLNQKIINTFYSFKPDLIVLGHADNVLKSTLEFLKNADKNLMISQWFLDPISENGPDFINNKKRILDKSNVIDATFVTTDPSSLSFEIKNSYYIPNPSDPAFETLKNYNNMCSNDLFFAMSHGVHRGKLKIGKNDNREFFLNSLIKKNKNINHDMYGFNNIQPIWGDNFISTLANSKMGLNLSRGIPLKYYSSDRIAQLMGNGLLTFIDQKVCYTDFFEENEIITYKNVNDLTEKLQRFKKDDKLRKAIARKGRDKYVKYFNSNLVAKFIINKSLKINYKDKYLWY